MRKNRLLLIWLLYIFVVPFCFSYVCYSQEYHKKVECCFDLLEKGDTVLFEEEYPTLFFSFYKTQVPEYGKAIGCIGENDMDGAFEYLDAVVDEDFLLQDIINDNDLMPLHRYPQWNSLLSRIDSIERNQNIAVKRELLEMQDRDQSMRLLFMEAEKKYGKGSEMALRVRKRMKAIDNLNIIRVQEIIDEHGWLGESVVGADGNQSLFISVQHVDDEVVQIKYLPILEKAVKQGNAEPWHLAFLTDRALMNQGKKQIYGTQMILGKTPEDSYIVPLEDPANVDKLRESIGLEPLSEYLEEEGLEWDLEQSYKRAADIEQKFNLYYQNKKKALE